MTNSDETKPTRFDRLMNLLCCKGAIFNVEETEDDEPERVIVETGAEAESDDAKVTLHEEIVIIEDEPKKVV